MAECNRLKGGREELWGSSHSRLYAYKFTASSNSALKVFVRMSTLQSNCFFVFEKRTYRNNQSVDLLQARVVVIGGHCRTADYFSWLQFYWTEGNTKHGTNSALPSLSTRHFLLTQAKPPVPSQLQKKYGARFSFVFQQPQSHGGFFSS